ncbi:MAG: AAA family ATPase [Candidatus Electrothrix communis]|nr:MAG: AAA family ATPase [Candidatus Electrothrix communis]
MPISSARSCPFIAGPMITDPSRFVGRREELSLLARRMDGAQPTSVNVIGERRMGKSSLLYHFFQTWEQRVNNPTRFVVVYLDLQAKTPPSESAFYQALGRALVKQPAIQRVESLRRNLLAPPRSPQDFAALLEQFSDHVLLPVFCLDEFEVLLKNGGQFTDIFFDRLRGFMNASQLMFILSSRRPLDVYAGEHDLTSAFFNLGHVVALGEFSEDEAEELVGLPVDGEPALDPEERQLALDWGGRHPYLLQMAGTVLFEAWQLGKKTSWAKKQFEAQRCRIQPVSTWKRQLSLQAIVQGYRRSLSGVADDASKWKTIILTFALLLVVGMVGYKLLTGTWGLRDLLDIGKLLK